MQFGPTEAIRVRSCSVHYSYRVVDLVHVHLGTLKIGFGTHYVS